MTEYVCMKCWNPFRPRKNQASSRNCSKCGSRIVRPLDLIADDIAKIRASFKLTQGMITQRPPLEETPVSDDIKNLPFKTAVPVIHRLRMLADMWNPDKMSVEEFLVLRLRAGIPTHAPPADHVAEEVEPAEDTETELPAEAKNHLAKLANPKTEYEIVGNPGSVEGMHKRVVEEPLKHALTQVGESTMRLCGARDGKFELAYNLVTCPDCIALLQKSGKLTKPSTAVPIHPLDRAPKNDLARFKPTPERPLQIKKQKVAVPWTCKNCKAKNSANAVTCKTCADDRPKGK